MMRFALLASIAVVLSSAPDIVGATDYRFCISSDKRPGHLLVKSGPADFGKEWYRVKAAQAFCHAYGASGCSASDYNPAKCGAIPEESLTYVSASGDQVKALFSGNPALMGQTAVEIVVGVPVKAAVDVAHGVGAAAHKACRWIAGHC